jgi:hypothetical protein
MIVRPLETTNISGVSRVQAEIVWEDADRAPFTLFVETEQAAQAPLRPEADAFLLACMLPAWRDREKRVRVEAQLCPALILNLRVAFAQLAMWYPELGTPPAIEAAHGFATRAPSHGRAVSLLSCGIDSLATLRWNKLHLPSEHPAAIRAVLPVSFAFRTPSRDRREFDERFDAILRAASPIARDAGVNILPLGTNIWWLADDGYFFDEKWHGSVLSALGAMLASGYSAAYVASSYDTPNLHAWGSHPMLDNYYSSSYFRIEHHGLALSRLEKTALVADWPAALDNLRVCQNSGSWPGNCGECEKCIRTMTALHALGKLDACGAFPVREVSVQLLQSVLDRELVSNRYQAQWYREIVPLLRARGRHDLAEVACQVVSRV